MNNQANETADRFWNLLLSLAFSFVVIRTAQWILALFDYHIAFPFDRLLFAVLTVYFWAPWKKTETTNENHFEEDIEP